MNTGDDRIDALERGLAELLRTTSPDDPKLAMTRNNLAILYRNRGQRDRATSLYAEIRLCEHLEPARRALLEDGATITYAGQPWSKNCRTWIYFDVLIDPDEMKLRCALPDCVVAHSHRGTHEGSERGLVCRLHHDALMGPYPPDHA